MADAGWYPDPSGAHEQRYFDGTAWTEHISNGGVTGRDPVPARPPSSDAYAPRVASDSWPNASAAPTPNGKTRWPVLIALGLLVIGGAIAAIALTSGGDDDDDASSVAVATTASGVERPTTTQSATATTEDVADTTIVDGAGSSPENPLALGSIATIEDYDVAIVGFTGDATEQVMQANDFNEPPDEGYVYALVRVRATYHGDDDGFPGLDLSVGYVGDGGRIYADIDCSAFEPESLMDEGQVRRGGTLEGNFCLHLPASVVGTGAVFAESFVSFDEEKVWWADS